MSLAVGKTRSSIENSKKCASKLWKLFPHVFLILLLVGYAALGAVLFWCIEGGSGYQAEGEYHEFLGKLLRRIQNYPGNLSSNSSQEQHSVKELENEINGGFKSIWLQRPERWTFYGSLFFCCTVFTTVGYGEIYPVTLPGKVVCILYAMVGIPLMLLVITDVGDLLAMLLSRAYCHLHSLFCRLPQYGRWSPSHDTEKPGHGGQGGFQDGTYTFSQEVVVREPMDIRQVLHSQQSVKRKSVQLRNNTEIFNRIIARENFNRQGPLVRSLSCPELDRMPPLPKGFAIWNFTGIGDNMDKLNVPLLLILVVVFAYILFGGLILPLWETEFNTFDAYYFCFITLTTIGFGDIVPNHPKYFMLTFVFIIMGMAIMSMAFKLGQSRIVSCYRQCMRCISGGMVERFEELGSD
ncbi:potassium channel subfamily K member 18 [Salvelinus fontinalis]|uniref:potassium channel subfamily K member 18 n=1 Tax=Salvelinus fontinalis TaxID=8038 RepID=UPI0024859A5B|nr:potassium channel subfamily K member 18 [Salvelinus fontinalis]